MKERTFYQRMRMFVVSISLLLVGFVAINVALPATVSLSYAASTQHASLVTNKTGVNGNPWGYNFTPGHVITHPPAAFCRYFKCINNFWHGRGYVMECHDGMYSLSGGVRGSCSYHKGNWRTLYSH